MSEDSIIDLTNIDEEDSYNIQQREEEERIRQENMMIDEILKRMGPTPFQLTKKIENGREIYVIEDVIEISSEDENAN